MMPTKSNKTLIKSSSLDDLSSARSVLDLEIAGLKALSDSLSKKFVAALDLLEKLNGRIIVTGMGKSGHIARKIAATLASTGTPALFVHPGEASHGDLGMITTNDAILALSNSGETSELADIVAYASKFKIPLVAITGGDRSTLARAATIALIYPSSKEACPMGLAPTTSTTVSLALGDALSITLLERKGFSSDDFFNLHPGGKLGQRLLKVSDIMHDGDLLPLVKPSSSMADAILEMTTKSFGCVGVIDKHGKLLGVITDGDLRRNMGQDLLLLSVSDVFTPGGKTINPQSLAGEAAHLMNVNKITNIFVVDNDKPVGILHIHDCLRAGVT